MAPLASPTVRADVTAPPPAHPGAPARVGAALGRDGRVRLRGLQLAATGPGRLRDVRSAPAPARPSPVPLPEEFADPVQILAARLAVTGRPQPDGWRRDVLVYAMLVDAAHTREKGRPASAAVVLGTHEAAGRLARREGRTATTGRDAKPDNTSFRRSLKRLEQAGLITRQVVRDVEDQERWTVCTLLPLPHSAVELADQAEQLLGRWLDERSARWTAPLRRLARRRADNTVRSSSRTLWRRTQSRTQNTQGASPCRSSPLAGAAEKANRPVEKKGYADANRGSTSKNRYIEEGGGEAEVRVQRLIVAVRPVQGVLTASEAEMLGNGGLGWLTSAERLRWSRAVDRWDRFRHVAAEDWAQLDAYQAAAQTMWDLTSGATVPTIRTTAKVLTRDERDGYIRRRPLAIVVRAMHQLTKDLARIAKDRRQKERLHQAAAAAIQVPRWIETDKHGLPLWRTSWDHVTLRARWLPDDRQLQTDARTIAALIHAYPTPLHARVPVSLGIVDRHGNYLRTTIRRAHSHENPGPHTPLRRATRRQGRRGA